MGHCCSVEDGSSSGRNSSSQGFGSVGSGNSLVTTGDSFKFPDEIPGRGALVVFNTASQGTISVVYQEKINTLSRGSEELILFILREDPDNPVPDRKFKGTGKIQMGVNFGASNKKLFQAICNAVLEGRKMKMGLGHVNKDAIGGVPFDVVIHRHDNSLNRCSEPEDYISGPDLTDSSAICVLAKANRVLNVKSMSESQFLNTGVNPDAFVCSFL